MKLRVKDRKELNYILSKARIGLDFLNSDRVAIMVKSNLSSSDMFRSSYYPNDSYTRITKEIGSDFVSLHAAIIKLEEMLK